MLWVFRGIGVVDGGENVDARKVPDQLASDAVHGPPRGYRRRKT
jgi:hypothetical protein